MLPILSVNRLRPTARRFN